MAAILIVDDDKDITAMLSLRLQFSGHEIHMAENGEVGIDQALAIKPDLILMDMHMPVMNGYDAVKALRDQGYDGLICSLSASAMPTDTSRAMEAGCNAYITKPIGRDFENQVAAIIDGKATADS